MFLMQKLSGKLRLLDTVDGVTARIYLHGTVAQFVQHFVAPPPNNFSSTLVDFWDLVSGEKILSTQIPNTGVSLCLGIRHQGPVCIVSGINYLKMVDVDKRSVLQNEFEKVDLKREEIPTQVKISQGQIYHTTIDPTFNKGYVRVWDARHLGLMNDREALLAPEQQRQVREEMERANFAMGHTNPGSFAKVRFTDFGSRKPTNLPFWKSFEK